MPNPTERRTVSSTGGEKGSKLARYDLIPAGPLHTLAELYGKGADKYEDRNWERGYEWSLSFAALNRHLWLFWQGVNIDAETGLPHLAAVAWHAFALMEWVNTHPEFDNRPGHTRLTEAVAAGLDDDDRCNPAAVCVCPTPHRGIAKYAADAPVSLRLNADGWRWVRGD